MEIDRALEKITAQLTTLTTDVHNTAVTIQLIHDRQGRYERDLASMRQEIKDAGLSVSGYRIQQLEHAVGKLDSELDRRLVVSATQREEDGVVAASWKRNAVPVGGGIAGTAAAIAMILQLVFSRPTFLPPLPIPIPVEVEVPATPPPPKHHRGAP